MLVIGPDELDTKRSIESVNPADPSEIVGTAASATPDHVDAAIESLAEDLRTAIMLREIEGLTYEEIAEAINCPIGTVRSRIFRARETISKQLRPLLDTPENKRW